MNRRSLSGYRRGPEEHRIGDAENGGIRTDAQGHGQDTHQRVSAMAVQQAQRESQIL